MANVDGAYCATEDLRVGDIPAPMGRTAEQYIKGAAEEIDAALGHLYVTPFVIDDTEPKNRPTILFLKKVNWLLASARYVLDAAVAGEQATLNAYGLGMLKEATAMLKTVIGEELVLTGAEMIDNSDPDAQKPFTGPAIFNEDPESLVQGFYSQINQNPFLPFRAVPPQPYGLPVYPRVM